MNVWKSDVSGTHRTYFLEKLLGMVEGSKTRDDWQKFYADRREFIEKRGPSYSGRIISSNGVDPFSKGYFQLYEGIVYEPEKFIPAHTKGMEEVWDLKEMQCFSYIRCRSTWWSNTLGCLWS